MTDWLTDWTSPPLVVSFWCVDDPKSVLICSQVDVVEVAWEQVVVAVVLQVRKDDASGDGFLGQVVADYLSWPGTVVVEGTGVDNMTSAGICLVQLMHSRYLLASVTQTTRIPAVARARPTAPPTSEAQRPTFNHGELRPNRCRGTPPPYSMVPSQIPYDLPFSHNTTRLALHSALWPFKVIQGQ